MDHSYVAIDAVDSVVKSGPSASPVLHNSPHIDSLLIKPTISSSMQLSHAPTGYYVDRSTKCEEITADHMFSRAAAVQLYDKLQLTEMVRYSALGGHVDQFRGLRSEPMPSCVPSFDVKDYIASSNSFNFLASADMQMSASASMNGLRMSVIQHDQAGHNNAKPQINSMMISSSLTGFTKGNMERQVLEANPSPPSKIREPSYAGNACKKLGSNYASDCISTSHLHVPSENHLFPDILARYSDSPGSPNSPSKQDSVLSAEDFDPDLQKSQTQAGKRRKTQQKKTVFVPVRDAKSNLKGETPPSDMWAWRKYGQKPIKGSPYPRGYYRCSSSKGCSARKQVERSCTDPTMLIVTYTSDHNHDWPVSKSTSLAAQVRTPSSPLLSKERDAEDHSEDVATTNGSCEAVSESLFSSIVNSVSSVDEQVVSSLDVPLHDDEEIYSLKSVVDRCFLSRTSTAEEDGVFDDLGELPELSSIFSKGYLEGHSHVDDGWLCNR
ncbi:hypothetical protein L7F22_037130 [Adiantum nelumboides]|nr:hypothetical protein [Adiantum nelumboides]